MMATATVSSTGPRYAPEDPTFPKPWKGLVDGKTGYLYFWNPETNVTETEYEKPAASSHTGSAPPQKLSAAPVSSSVQVEQSSHGHCDSIFNDDEDRYNGGSNSGSKLDIGTRSYQGDNVPPPLTSFETIGFPSELLREVQYLLLGGAKCRMLCYPLMRGLEWDCTHEHHHRPPPAIVSPIQKHECVSGGRFLLRRGRSIPISLAEESKARTAFWK